MRASPTSAAWRRLTVFGPANFRNEIIWKRTTAHSDARQGFSHVTDTILFYAKSDATHWRPQYRPHKGTYIASHYGRADQDGRQFRHDNIIRSASMGLRPNLTYEYKGFTPPYGWRVVREKLEGIDASKRLVHIAHRPRAHVAETWSPAL